jgi:RHS repeat-associated protein
MLRTISNKFTTHTRLGYQGSEKDNEVKGSGNSYTTQFRQLDPRLGRWWSIDPKLEAGVSPYSSMDNDPIRYNDILGQYTEKRAERKKAKAEKMGYSVSDVKHNEGGGKKDYYFNISKRNDENTGTYNRTMLSGKLSGLKEQHLTLDSEHETSFFDLGLATSSALIDKGKDITKTITNSRSGYTSGSRGNGSGKIYNKAQANLVNKTLTGLGYTLNAVSVISSEIDYSQGEITKGRRDFNRLNAGTSLAFPVVGIPMAAGDYLGQKYHPQIEHQVTQGLLNKVMVGVLDFMGLQTTPYPRSSNEEKEYLKN